MARAMLLVLPSLLGRDVANGASEAALRPQSVAVIGGGIAGATTVLELLAQKEWDVDITLFEQAGEIGHAKSASGIIAASMIFNAPTGQYWKGATEFDDVLRQLQSVEYSVDGIVDLRISSYLAAVSESYSDPRADKDNQKSFFTAAKKRLEEIVDMFPKLCFALVGPWCCRAGSNASKWMMSNSEVGVSCDGIVGWGHSFYDESEWAKADDERKALEAHEFVKFERGELGTDIFHNVSDFWRADGELKGTLFSTQLGFTRVEDIFPKLREIFEESGVTIRIDCLVTDIGEVSTGTTTSLLVRVSDSSSCHAAIGDGGAMFDRVVVASGANSKSVLKDHDDRIYSQIMPVKGFAVATDSPLIPEHMRTLGSQQEEFSHYVRPQRNGGVRYGYGKVMGIPDEELLDPTYDSSWEDYEVAGIKLTQLGQEVLQQGDVLKLAGVRPLSCFNNFPLLKTYPSIPGLILNTGYGWHGFVLCWKSSRCVAEWVLHGYTVTEDCAYAVESHAGCDMWTISCWRKWPYLLVPVLIGLVTSVCISLGLFVAFRKYQAAIANYRAAEA